MINVKQSHVSDSAYLKQITVVPDLRNNTKILMEVISLSDTVPSVRNGICFFAVYFASNFMSIILTPIEREGIPSLGHCL
jgi:hypothetical protein